MNLAWCVGAQICCPNGSKDEKMRGRMLLGFNPDGERLKAGISIGNPDLADHVGTVVPGLNTTAESLGGDGDGMVDEAERVRDESQKMLRDSPETRCQTVSTIAWLGYEPPVAGGPGNPGKLDVFGKVIPTNLAGRGGVEVTQLDRAVAGGDELSSFLQGRELNAPEGQHTSVLAHSYGTITSGYALENGGRTDDFLVYGSPGLDADTTKEFNVPKGLCYNMTADGDKVPLADRRPWGGISSPDELGFTRLETGPATVTDGSYREGSHGHSEYSRASDKGQLRTTGYNIAAVVAGRPELAVR